MTEAEIVLVNIVSYFLEYYNKVQADKRFDLFRKLLFPTF